MTAITSTPQQQVTLRCRGAPGSPLRTFTRPLSALLRYPDSVLARMVRDLQGGSPSTLLLDLGTSCDPGPLEVALHVHATGSLCGAPLPPDVTLEWVEGEVLRRYGLPPLLELSIVEDPTTVGSTLPQLERLLQAAGVRVALGDIFDRVKPLTNVHMLKPHSFAFHAAGAALRACPWWNTCYNGIGDVITISERVLINKTTDMRVSEAMVDDKHELIRLTNASCRELEQQLKALLPGHGLTWKHHTTLGRTYHVLTVLKC